MTKKTKCTPEITEKAVKLIKEGFTYSALAAGLGISEDTLFLWFRKAKNDGLQPYLSFYAAVKNAEAALLSECLQAVKASMKAGDARSAYFLLERRFGDSYSKKDSLQVDQRTQSVSLNLNASIPADETERIRTNILSKLQRKPALPLQEGEE